MILLDQRKTDCTACDGAGRIRVNVTQDPTTGTWDYDEDDCVSCFGTGQLPAAANYETFTLPGQTRALWRCRFCECTVDPHKHLPGSEDCHRAAEERRVSREDWAS